MKGIPIFDVLLIDRSCVHGASEMKFAPPTPLVTSARMTSAPPPPLPAHLKVDVRPSLIPNAGWGLFARERIRNGRRIGRYRGTVYYNRSGSDSVPESHKPYLMDTVEGGVIDGYRMDNHMRWANHSTMPNAYAHLENDGVVFFIALRDIEPDEEIYIDYGYDPTVPDRTVTVPRCQVCHSAGVRGEYVNIDYKKERDLYCLVCVKTHII